MLSRPQEQQRGHSWFGSPRNIPLSVDTLKKILEKKGFVKKFWLDMHMWDVKYWVQSLVYTLQTPSKGGGVGASEENGGWRM